MQEIEISILFQLLIIVIKADVLHNLDQTTLFCSQTQAQTHS